MHAWYRSHAAGMLASRQGLLYKWSYQQTTIRVAPAPRMDAPSKLTAAAPLAHHDARLITFGVLLPLFMGSIDNTILASALPTIGREFSDVRGLPWLITIYLLAATAAMPLYGKLADIHGRE